jgi:hypothetical protein
MGKNKNVILLGNELNTNTFEVFLSELSKKIEEQYFSEDKIIFDMSKLRHVRIGGLISFLSLCGAIKENKLFNDSSNFQIYIEYPMSQIMEYLHWMQFFKVANIYGLIQNIKGLSEKDEEYYEKWKTKLKRYHNEIDPVKREYYKAKIFPIHFIPPNLNKFEFDSTCWNFMDKIIGIFKPILKYDLDFPEELWRGFFEANYELYKNIFDHSKSWGAVAIQVLKNETIFSYSDIGIGIKNSLSKFIKVKYNLSESEIDDCFAIKEALKKGVSSKEINQDVNSSNRGDGLYIVTKYIKKSRGRMIIRSGRCLYPVDSIHRKVCYFPGTQIHIALPKVNNKV